MGEKLKALVVDDAPDLLLYETFLLEGLGLEVVGAPDGETALELARTLRPALICLDLVLPTIGGFDVVEALRQDPATAAIPVLITSARRSPHDRAEAEALGAAAYVTKPIDPYVFISAARSLIRRQPTAA